MRILHVTHNYPPESLAGVEVHVWRLARAQRARGHEVLVFSGSERGAGDEAADGASYEGIPLVQVHRTEDPGRAAWSRLTRLHDPAIVRRFDDVMRALRPEVVHVHHLLNLCWSLPWMARRMGARTRSEERRCRERV